MIPAGGMRRQVEDEDAAPWRPAALQTGVTLP